MPITSGNCWSRRARTTSIADTHWYRPDFDRALVEEAEAAGAIYLDMTRLDGLRQEGATTILDGEREGRSIRIAAPFVIDASGPRGFLHRALGLGEVVASAGCRRRRVSTRTSSRSIAGTTCIQPAEPPPYPIDDAAVHQVFPGGWIWMLRFNNGLTSAGAALTDPAAASHWRRRRRRRLGPADERAAVRARTVPAARERRCPSFTRRGCRSAARGLRDRRGPCCRRRPA